MPRGRSFSRTDAEMSRIVKAGADLAGPALKKLCRKERISVATWYNWARKVNGKKVTAPNGATYTVINLADMEAHNAKLSEILAKAVKLKREEQALYAELSKVRTN